MTLELGAIAGPAERDLDRHLAAGLTGADPDGRRVLGQHDRVRADVADGPPGEQQVGQLLEGRPTLGHHLELAALEPELVLRLDEEAAADPLEVEVGDAVVAHPLGSAPAGTARISRPVLARRIPSADSL